MERRGPPGQPGRTRPAGHESEVAGPQGRTKDSTPTGQATLRRALGGGDGESVVQPEAVPLRESEYLLNGKLCRLRDISGAIHGHGAGTGVLCPERAAGASEQILSAVHDRRAPIEEDCRHHKFKTKKRIAEARLEESKQNWRGVNEIFEEVTRQIGNSLKAAGSKAARYAKWRSDACQAEPGLPASYPNWSRKVPYWTPR